MKAVDTEKQDRGAEISKTAQIPRQRSTFRSYIEKGGKHEPELGRYHLVAALACPWAHRALIVRRLKGIDKVPGLLPVSLVDSLLGPEGWSFVPYAEIKGIKSVPGTGCKIPGHEDKKRIRELYLSADPEYKQRCTVPVIWDTKLNTIVNNESSEVIRNLNDAFDDFIAEENRGISYYPEHLRQDIDAINEWVYTNINNGVYKCGFATDQDAYKSGLVSLFSSLDRIEQMLQDSRTYLCADRLTEADIRLYTSVVRFDPVYVVHYKCNSRTIRGGYPHIHRWMQNLYWNNRAFKDTTDFASIKSFYFQSQTNVNPLRIIPEGPIPHILPMAE